MKTSNFDYELPKSFVAQEPVELRDHSKMMIYNRSTGEPEHKHFYDLVDYLDENDVLVVNNSKVIPARILFDVDEKEKEIFILRRIDQDKYKVLVRPGKYFVKGKRFDVQGEECEITEVLSDGSRIVKTSAKLEKFGEMPLPPYISNKNVEFEKYQTVYAEKEGSVAAPTAGLHFTEELILKLIKKGVQIEYVMLHVGRGTFLPVKSEKIEDHEMHSEYFELTEETAERLNRHKKLGKRIVAVGTTSVRVLESSFDPEIGFVPFIGETDIFIHPGYKWKVVDSLITNFHLPKSTLLMLVSSFLGSVEKMHELYKIAKKEKYRFYSFGDCMFLF
ncbi:MAG: tRNA preQ1(34) S-adenosylmethionine ribosyltransferase-isomerase QueA [Nitrospirota bacterium]